MAVDPVDFSRRDFLKTSATVSGGLLIGIALPGCKPAAQATGETTYVTPNADGRQVISQAGRYDDTLVREDGRWKFKRRVASNDIPSAK